jgi:hypothetical protein
VPNRQLRSGIREPQHIGQEFAQKAAAYLGVPTVLAQLLADQLTFGKFAWPQRSQDQDIADGLAAMRDDPVLGRAGARRSIKPPLRSRSSCRRCTWSAPSSTLIECEHCPASSTTCSALRCAKPTTR